MEWIDIGVNLTDKAFAQDREAVLERAWQADVSQMLLTMTSLEQADSLLALCAEQPQRLFTTAGVHHPRFSYGPPTYHPRIIEAVSTFFGSI